MMKLISAVALLITAPLLHSEDVLPEATALISEACEQLNTPGFAISIAVKDKFSWSGACGFADLEQNVPVSPATTKFRVGSIAKPFTDLGPMH